MARHIWPSARTGAITCPTACTEADPARLRSIRCTRDGEAETLPTMISTTMAAGEVIYHRQAGGGGLGRPTGAPTPKPWPEMWATTRFRAPQPGTSTGVILDESLTVDREGYLRPAGTAGSREHMSPAPADLLIRGGTVIDGTGKAPPERGCGDQRRPHCARGTLAGPGTADRGAGGQRVCGSRRGFYRHPQSFRFYFAGRPSGDEFNCPRG